MLAMIATFAVLFACLISGAQILVWAAEHIARRIRVSDAVIGLTVVAFGTSLPEFVVNVSSSLTDSTDLAVGNIIGSNIFNIAIVLGVSALLSPIKLTRQTMSADLPIALMASLFLLFVATIESVVGTGHAQIDRVDGALMIVGFVGFMMYIHRQTRRLRPITTLREAGMPMPIYLGSLVLGLILLIGAGRLIVDHATSLALSQGVALKTIGLTIIALGTSLPELATTLIAVLRRNHDMAIGNIIGSNIFNILWILGVTAILRPISISPTTMGDITAAALVHVLLIILLLIGGTRRMSRWQGGVLLCTYCAYMHYVWLTSSPL